MFTRNGAFVGAAAHFGIAPGVEAHPFGYWVVPVALVLGLGIFVVTQRISRRILSWMRSRKPPARIALKIAVVDRGPR